MDLFFDEKLASNQTTFTFDSDESKHISRVLRKSVGDKLCVTNGAGLVATVEISEISKKAVVAQIVNKEQQLQPATFFGLALACLRKADRFEFAIEKAVELGVQELHLFFGENNQHLGKFKKERIEAKITAALKQSQRYFRPKLYLHQSLEACLNDLKKINDKAHLYLAHEKANNAKSIHELDFENLESPYFFVGPEGGFSDKEIELIKKYDGELLYLGDYRLRAETAAVVISSVISMFAR